MKALEIEYLVDAGPLVGLLSEADQWHDWSAATLTLIEEPLATTESVLAEACHLLGRFRPGLIEVINLVASGRLVVLPVLAGQPARLGELLAKYPRMDLGDASLVALSELLPRARLITLDVRDFRVYRRRDGKLVPAIMPELPAR